MTFLERVTAETRKRVAAASELNYFAKLAKKAELTSEGRERDRFKNALSKKDAVNIIAEVKRASPSKGVIRADVDVPQLVRAYESGGAAAISVLTEPNHFDGCIADLVSAGKHSTLPLLRKDFVVDEYQVVEAAAAGASAILLIVAALPIEKLAVLHDIAEQLGLNILVEVHDEEEMQKAIDVGASMIGVNNRSLRSLEVSLETSRRLIADKPDGIVMIAESGISTRDEIDELRGLGFDGFLIGETLMRSGDIVGTLRGLTE